VKILITGGTGFIGSHLNGNIKLSSNDVELMDLNDTISCFKKHSPDVIIHSAAKQKNHFGMLNFKADHLYDNTIINMNVFKAAQIVDVKKMVSLSSINAFPASPEKYYTESNLWNGEPHNACYTDGYCNRLLHILSKAYNSQYNITCAVPMLTNTYGPNSKITNGVVPYLINKCYEAMVSDIDFVIDGDGSPIRDFIYVKDVARLIDWSVQEYDSIEPIIFSSGKQNTIKQLVELIVDYIGFKGKVVWNKDISASQSVKLCDNTKLKKYLPDFKFTSMEDGLIETIDWYLNSKENINE